MKTFQLSILIWVLSINFLSAQQNPNIAQHPIDSIAMIVEDTSSCTKCLKFSDYNLKVIKNTVSNLEDDFTFITDSLTYGDIKEVVDTINANASNNAIPDSSYQLNADAIASLLYILTEEENINVYEYFFTCLDYDEALSNAITYYESQNTAEGDTMVFYLDMLTGEDIQTEVCYVLGGVNCQNPNPALWIGNKLSGEIGLNRDFDELEEQTDIFSDMIKGLDHMESGEKKPAASAQQLINNIQVGTDLFNGTSDVQETITTIDAKDVNIPINVNYNGQGLKINSTGSDLGTGWNISSGGEITRIVKDLPDDLKETVRSYGAGPTGDFNGCVTKGLIIGTFAPKVVYSILNPSVITFNFNTILSIGPFPIPCHVSLTIEISYINRPGFVLYDEERTGYFHLNSEGIIINESITDAHLAKALGQGVGYESVNDFKFILPKLGNAIGFVQELIEIFDGESYSFNPNSYTKRKIKNYDVEPDEFHFQLGSYSGKFLFSQNQEITIFPHQNLKIEHEIKNGELVSFKVTTPEGLVYTFGNIYDGNNLVKKGVEYIQHNNYTLPNYYTYPEVPDGNGEYQRRHFGKAKLLETQNVFYDPQGCYNKVYSYGANYQYNYNVNIGSTYIASWKLMKIESLITKANAEYSYIESQPLEYYSNKSYFHKIPNLSYTTIFGDKVLKANIGDLEGTLLFGPSFGKRSELLTGNAELTYKVTDTKLFKLRLKTIENSHFQQLVFNYDDDSRETYNEKLLTSIELKEKTLNQQFNTKRKWEFLYLHNQDKNIAFTHNDGYHQAEHEYALSLGNYHPKKVRKSVRCLGLGVSLAFYYSIEREHLSYDNELREYGSLMNVKHWINKINWDDFDIYNESKDQEKYKKEFNWTFLEKINEISGKDSLVYNTLQFEYEGNINSLPKRYSPEQDKWGYYNDNPSKSFLPKLKFISWNNELIDADIQADLEVIDLHFGFKHIDDQGDLNQLVNGRSDVINLEKNITGALKSIHFVTGASKSFEYELNQYPIGSEIFEGAGIRVKKIISDPGNALPNVIEYAYQNPKYAVAPIFQFTNPFDYNNYLKEKYHRSSSVPLNQIVMNKGNYIGYTNVTQFHGSSQNNLGYTNYTFKQPNLSSSTITKKTFNLAFLELSLPEFITNYTSFSAMETVSNMDPFPIGIPDTWNFGLIEKREMYNIDDDLVDRSIYYYKAFDLSTGNDSYGIKHNIFQQYFPGTFNENLSAGYFLIFNKAIDLVSQFYGLTDFVQDIVILANNIYSFFTSFNNTLSLATRAINKTYCYEIEKYDELSQLKLRRILNYNYFENGSYTRYNEYYRYLIKPSLLAGELLLLRYKTSFSPESPSLRNTQYYYYTGIDPINLLSFNSIPAVQGQQISMDHVLDADQKLSELGIVYPFKTFTKRGPLTNSHHVGGSVDPFILLNNELYPLGQWQLSVIDGNLTPILSYLNTSFDIKKNPIKISKAAFNISGDYEEDDFLPPVEVKYNHFDAPIEFSVEFENSDGISQNFKRTYLYNRYREMVKYTDENGIVSEFMYDGINRLINESYMNSHLQTSHNYNYNPPTIKSTTTFDDGDLPDQSNTQYFTGFGQPLKLERHDGSILSSVVYDEFSRVKVQSTLQTGSSYNYYEPSPINRIKATKDAVGNINLMGYEKGPNGAFQTNITTDPNLAVTEVQIDALGRTIEILDGEGGVTKNKFDDLGRLESITNPNNEVYTYTYNKMHLPSSIKIPGKFEKDFIWYNRFYRKVLTKDPNDNLLFYTYDNIGRLETIQKIELSDLPNGLPDNNIPFDEVLSGQIQIKYTYETGKTWLQTLEEVDAQSNDISLNKTTNTYDEFGRIKIVDIQRNDQFVKTTFTLNDASLVSSKTVNHWQENEMGSKELAFIHNYQFDNLLRPSKSWLQIEDLNDNLTGDMQNRLLSQIAYNNRDLISTQYLGGDVSSFLQKIDYGYDPLGRLTTINSPIESECFKEDEFCDLSLQLNSGNSSCEFLQEIIIDEIVYPINNTLSIFNLDNKEEIMSSIENIIFEQGFLGTVNVRINNHSSGAINFNIDVINSNINNIILVLDGCQHNLLKINCCAAPEIDPDMDPSFDGLPILFDTDLYYQSINYDGINISNIDIANDCEMGFYRNQYSYDNLHRLKSVQNNLFASGGNFEDAYSSNYSYDPVGNIMSIERNGLISINSSGDQNIPSYGIIDQLGYTYIGDRLNQITETTNIDKGFKSNFTNYSWDNNGNLIGDTGKEIIDIEYNVSNMPTTIQFTDLRRIVNNYTFTGERTQKVIIDENASPIALTNYIQNIEKKLDDANNLIFDSYYLPEGRVTLSENDDIEIHYNIKDHLGNTMVVFKEEMDDESGNSNPVALQRHMYYSFGMELDGQWNFNLTEDPSMNYRYNGKELDKDHELDWYAYGARFYDPAIGRFTGVDPISDQFPHVSTYNYAENEPIRHIDLHGLQKALKDNDGVVRNYDDDQYGGTYKYNYENEYWEYSRTTGSRETNQTTTTWIDDGDGGWIQQGSNKESIQTGNGSGITIDHQAFDTHNSAVEYANFYGNILMKTAGAVLPFGGATWEVGGLTLKSASRLLTKSNSASNRAFWSGAGTEAKALRDGFQTLGQTRAGQNLAKLTADMQYYPGSQAYNMWARLSTTYAKGAKGVVNVYQNADQGVGMQSIWRLYEYPALKANPNVTNIIFHY